MSATNPSETPTVTGQIIVLSGPSGVGKGSLCERLLQKTEGLTTQAGDPLLVLSVSVTSRPLRDGEIDGVSYTFVSRQQFEGMIATESFLEWAEYNGNYYGTPKQTVLGQLVRGMLVLLEIEVQGALQVKSRYPAARLVFITPPPGYTGNPLDTLRERLKTRGNTPEVEIERRIRISAHELTQQTAFDHVLVNDSLDACCEHLIGWLNIFSPQKI